jgi:F-type H+-transporting ATPase subunit delta
VKAMSQIADRYAKMFYELALKEGRLETVHEAMTEIGGLIADLKEFRLFLRNPLLSFEEQGRILTAMFKGKIEDALFMFLLFIAYKRRLDVLKDIIESFDQLYLSGKGQLRALVKTALPLGDREKAFINQRLEDKFERQMITQWSLDPSLIGGFRIFVQGQIFDYSFKNQLNHYFYRSMQPA